MYIEFDESKESEFYYRLSELNEHINYLYNKQNKLVEKYAPFVDKVLIDFDECNKGIVFNYSLIQERFMKWSYSRFEDIFVEECVNPYYYLRDLKKFELEWMIQDLLVEVDKEYIDANNDEDVIEYYKKQIVKLGKSNYELEEARYLVVDDLERK